MKIMGYLKISWSISRGRDTEGYNICRLDDLATGRRYKCMGGGYDMTGSNLGQWLQAMYQERLVAIGDRASYVCPDRNDAGLYGMHYYPATDKKSAHVNIDGGYGVDSVIKIAAAIGIELTANYNRRTRKTEGYFYHFPSM